MSKNPLENKKEKKIKIMNIWIFKKNPQVAWCPKLDFVLIKVQHPVGVGQKK